MALDARIQGQENAFRKVALRTGHLDSKQLDRAQRERERLAARGIDLAVYQVVLKLGLLDIEGVKAVLREIDQHYFICRLCGRENPRKEGAQRCRYCHGTGKPVTVRRQAVVAEEPPEDPLVGEQVGKFQILARIGEGGSGRVYKARQLGLDRLVAVKVLHPALAAQEDRAKRFLREAKAMARVEHPHVVPIYDYGQDRGSYYLVMGYQPGEDLGRLLSRRGKLTVPESLDLTCQALRGLEALHQSGVIHRDLKPDNILVTPDGRAMVMDFGLVRDIKPAEELTQSQQILGTPYYMSPEQCLNKDLDARTDLYSLGVTLYQMLTGTRPFTGENAIELMMSHLFEEPPPPDQVAIDLDRDLSAVVMKMMARDKRGRYASAADALEDLELFSRGRRPRAARLQRRWRLGRRWRRVAQLAAVALVLAAVGMAAVLLRGARPEPAVPGPVGLGAAEIEHWIREGQARERLAMARDHEKTPAGRQRTPEEWRDWIGRCIDLYLEVGRRFGGTEAAQAASRRAQQLVDARLAGPDPGPPEPAPDPVRPAPQPTPPAVAQRQRRAEARVRWQRLARRMGALVGAGRHTAAHELLTLAGRAATPIQQCWLDVLDARLRGQLADALAEGVRRSAQAEAAGRLEHARRWLTALDLPDADLRTRRDGRLAALEQRVKVAAQRRRARQLADWTPVARAIREALQANQVEAARQRLSAYGHRTAPTPVETERALLVQDIDRVAQARQLTRDALTSRVGRTLALRLKSGAPLRGRLVRHEGDAPFRLEVDRGQLPFGIDDLHPETILALVGADAPVAVATWCLYRGQPGFAHQLLGRLEPTPEAAAELLQRVRAALGAQLIRQAEAALAGGHVERAYEALRGLSALPATDPAALDPAFARLARLATGKWRLHGRRLYAASPVRLKPAGWTPRNLPRGGRLEHGTSGTVLDLSAVRGGEYVELFDPAVQTPPYRLELDVLRPKLTSVAVVVGRVAAARRYLAIEIAPARGLRIWRRQGGTGATLRDWQAIGSSSAAQLTIALTVLADRVAIEIDGRVRPPHMEAIASGGIGIAAPLGSRVELIEARLVRLKLVPDLARR